MDGYNSIEKLYVQYSKRIYGSVFLIVKDRSLAEELVHDTFLQAMDKIDTVRDFSKIESWLLRIAINKTYNFLRARKKISAFPLAVAEEADDSNANDPVKFLTDEETCAEIRRAIGLLQPDMAALIILYYFDNMTFQEIASLLDIPSGTVKTRIYRARQTLKKFLLQNTREVRCDGKPVRQVYP
jgi:RNA polymerase sigma-70 factor (ECF subfamily)